MFYYFRYPFPWVQRQPVFFPAQFKVNTFDPYKVELPSFHTVSDKSIYCKKQCASFGLVPGTVVWLNCINGCNSYLGSLLDDPQFIEDME
ncbi:hypothetical protein [Bacillus sp. FJAT-45350]|uniref:hypothetical protein n=1 Tax=Bacillus sp. FJAT-45350 TaxID=2011014 RepID=UPI000BB861CB|nr:hypothetical protein [Bacillus sp. FJAT-45350]